MFSPMVLAPLTRQNGSNVILSNDLLPHGADAPWISTTGAGGPSHPVGHLVVKLWLISCPMTPPMAP
jgi:hypothetical protein